MMMASEFSFVVNISRLFSEHEFIKRFEAAKKAGFDYVEITTPLAKIGHSAGELKKAKDDAGVKVALMNGCMGQGDPRSEIGVSALPDKQEKFEIEFAETLEYAKALKSERVHIMAGNIGAYNLSEVEATFKKNIRYAASELEKIGCICQIEFVCAETAPDYFLKNASTCVNIIKELDRPNLKLQLDIYHLHMTEDDLMESIKMFLPFSSYIQVSQTPNRNELDYPGDINYRNVFKLLKELDYHGCIGLEYSPSKDTLTSFSWMKDWNYV